MNSSSKSSPWGAIQSSTRVAEGIRYVSTSSHGGVLLSAERNRKVPEYMRLRGGAYEHDNAIAVPMVVFAEEFAKAEKKTVDEIKTEALLRLREWQPNEYEEYTGIAIKEGESYTRDRDRFSEVNRENLVVISAIAIDGLMVHCTARVGGHDRLVSEPERYFLVPRDEYRTRSRHGFIIDPEKHSEMSLAAGIALQDALAQDGIPTP